MIVQFGNKKWEATQLNRRILSLRLGDLVNYEGNVWEVETVQRAHDLFLHPFIMLILRSPAGVHVSSRNRYDESTICYRRKAG